MCPEQENAFKGSSLIVPQNTCFKIAHNTDLHYLYSPTQLHPDFYHRENSLQV